MLAQNLHTLGGKSHANCPGFYFADQKWCCLSGVVLAQEYVVTMTCQKLECLKQLQKTRKQLKQLAILQKSIKQAISEYRVDYEVMFGGD